MWQLWFLLGGLLWTVTIAVSVSMNVLFWTGFAHSDQEYYTFAALGVVIDGFKALLPMLIYALWRSSFRAMAFVFSVGWVFCVTLAISSAIGIAGKSRDASIAGRESVNQTYGERYRDLDEAQRKRHAMPAARGLKEVEGAIVAVLARPVKGGTVGTRSKDCTADDYRAREGCAEIAALRQEAARANEVGLLDARIERLQREVEGLRGAGGTLEADPQAQLLSVLTGGLVAKRYVPLVLLLVLAGIIEFLSAFMPIGLSMYATTHRGKKTNESPSQSDMTQARPAMARSTRRQPVVIDAREVGQVVDFMTERTEPGRESEALSVGELHGDYRAWCKTRRCEALSADAFIGEVERVRIVHRLADRIGKTDVGYSGIRFVHVRALTGPVQARARRNRA